MASLKKNLVARGMRMMSDPRVVKLLQDPRVVKALMTAMAMPARARSFAKEQAETVARAMAFATEGEVKDLRRQIRRLEEEVDRLRSDAGSDAPSPHTDSARPQGAESNTRRASKKKSGG